MKKFTIILIVLFACGTVYSQDAKTYRVESQSQFKVTVVKPLNILKSTEVLDLGIIKPGERKSYEGSGSAISFRITGESLKKIQIDMNLTCSSDKIKIEEMDWEYYDGSNWKPVSTDKGGSGNSFMLENMFNLNSLGEAAVRLVPKVVKADEDIQEEENYFFTIDMSCQYKDI